jgi:hypothetical protein
MRSEASIIALGKTHLGMGLNNVGLFYPCDGKAAAAGGGAAAAGPAPEEVEYVSTIRSLSMNQSMAAVLCEGRVQLHRVAGDADGRHTQVRGTAGCGSMAPSAMGAWLMSKYS